VLKFATFEVLSSVLVPENATRAELRILAHKHSFDYEPRPGFLYVRSRAISSRCNDNFDEFPAEEIKKGFRTFIGKPVFVNHNNDNHRRARGVVIDAALHEDKNPDGSPDIWVEALMEVDAKNFPKLAKAILAGEIARTSMGTDVDYSICSICNNKATTPAEYCAHIPRMKGQRIYRHTANGQKEGILVREICYGLRFFENSLLVEPPADPTAYFLGVDTRGIDKAASIDPSKQDTCPHPTWNLHGQCKTCGYTAFTESDEECDHPYCQESGFADGWHTKGEHIDPPHLDPGHEDYQSAEKNVNDAIGNHPDAWLLHHQSEGPTKYSVMDFFKQASTDDIPKIQTSEVCEECGKPKDHLHISPEAQDEMRAAAEAGQMHAEMADHNQKRVVNTKDPHDLKAHLMEAHGYDESDFWRNSHAEDHPALKEPDYDFDRDVDDDEVHSLHNWEHGHGIKNDHPDYHGGEPGHFFGDSHFHTAKMRKQTTWIGDHPDEPTLFWRAPKTKQWEVHISNHMPDRDLREGYGAKPSQQVTLYHADHIAPPHPNAPKGSPPRGGWSVERHSHTGEVRYNPTAWGNVVPHIPPHVEKQVHNALGEVDKHAQNHAELFGGMADIDDINSDQKRVPHDMAAEEKGHQMFKNLVEKSRGDDEPDEPYVTSSKKASGEPDEVHRGLELPAAGEEESPGHELGRSLWNGVVNAMGFDSTEEMRLHNQNSDSEALRERFKGGSGKHGFEDEHGGDAYYEVRHPSGYKARAYNGGPYVDVTHVATPGETHDVINVAEEGKHHPTVDVPHEELYKRHPDTATAKSHLSDWAQKQGHDLHWDRPGHAKCKNCETWAQVSDDEGGAMTLGNAMHTGCGGGRPKMPDSYGHEDLKKDLHEWVRDYGQETAENTPKIQRWQRHGSKQATTDAEFEDLVDLPPWIAPSHRARSNCRNCGATLVNSLEASSGLCPNCDNDGGRKTPQRQREKLMRTLSSLRRTAAYYGEEGQYPQKGEIVNRGEREGTSPTSRWGGANYDFHRDGDRQCDHQQAQSWRDAGDHCEGHYNPPHPLQAAIDKYNNYKGRRSHVPIMHNTWIHKDDQDNFHIKHHNTDIISVAPNGDTTVNVNGYHTATTGKRLSQFLPHNVKKMRNPSKAQGASEHSLAINPTGGSVFPDWENRDETKGKYGLHKDTVKHDYTDGISFNAHTGERLEDNAVRPTSDPVRPPQARGTEDPGPPVRRPGPSAPGGWHDPYRGRSEPSYTPSAPREPGEDYSREQDQRELQHAERSRGSDSSHYDEMSVHYDDDMPQSHESFEDWMNRTSPSVKAKSPISKCPSCQGRGRTGPFGSKTNCRKCEGAGYLNQQGQPHHEPGFTAKKRLYAEAMTKHHIAFGEIKAPADVDTLRDEECPVCGETDSYDGTECQVCGFIAPPKMFQDPDLDMAKQVDLRQDQDTFQDANAGMPDEVPGSEFAGTDETGEPGVVDPAQVGEDGSIAGPQVGDDPAVVDGEVRTLGDEGLVDPTQVDEEGNVMDPTLDPDAATGHVDQGGEPFTQGPNVPQGPGGPEGPEGPMEEAEESPEAGFPGTPGDGVADLSCPSCGFQAPGASPMSTNMNDPMAPVGEGDGLLVGDVCPNCQRATLISAGEINQMQEQEQAVKQQQGLV
jgi:hypothetical protein